MAELPRVLLLGDSIRMGYQPAATALLSDRVEVVAPVENCRFTGRILEHLQEWALAVPADIIHVNAGLHDVAVLEKGAHVRVPFDDYRRNVETILRTLQSETKAAIIWVATTPVMDDRVLARHGYYYRTNADVIRYNEAAFEIAGSLGIPVNRLDEVVIRSEPARIMNDDGVHFTPEGYAILGDAVARCVIDALT